MAVVEVSSFLITSFVGMVALARIINDARKSLCSIILNIMFGGTLFIILNIIGVDITLNLITGSVVTLLGIPGVILLIVLKTIFKIF